MEDKNSFTIKEREFFLEQALLGEASPEVLAKIEADPLAKLRLDSLRSENMDFLKRYPPHLMAAEIREKATQKKHFKFLGTTIKDYLTEKLSLRQGKKTFGFGLLAGLPLALILGIFTFQAFVASRSDIREGTMVAMDDSRTKGMDQGIIVYRQVAEGSSELKNNSAVEDFEKIQIAYRPGEGNYGFIFSLDGRGRLTLHYPESFGSSMIMQAGSQTLLPFAYQLDDAPNFERFYLAVSKQDFKLMELWSNLEQELEKKVKASGGQLLNPPNLELPTAFKTVYLDLKKSGGKK